MTKDVAGNEVQDGHPNSSAGTVREAWMKRPHQHDEFLSKAGTQGVHHEHQPPRTTKDANGKSQSLFFQHKKNILVVNKTSTFP